MPLRATAVAALLVLGCTAGPLFAQESPIPATQPPPEVDVTKLPVNLGRLQTRLRQAAEYEAREGPLLRYTIEVIGQAPRIELYVPEQDAFFAPAPYGAPTHRDMINLATPKEFSSPMMDFGALIRWLGDRSKDRR